MDAVLEALSAHPGEWAFLLLLACGMGLPPWSEELVLLACGWFVAQGDLSYLGAVGWAMAGILAGDSVMFGLGRLAGDRVHRWPLLRRSFRPAKRRRFNHYFLRYGTRVVFLARFLPGVRLVTYLVAGNLGMPWWKFLALDGLAALVTIPVAVWVGWKFAANLDEVAAWLHRFELPLAALAGALVLLVLQRLGRARRLRLDELRRRRRERDFGGPGEGRGDDAGRGGIG